MTGLKIDRQLLVTTATAAAQLMTLDTTAGAGLALTAALVGTAQFDVDYDRSLAPGRVSTDRSVAFTLGYRF